MRYFGRFGGKGCYFAVLATLLAGPALADPAGSPAQAPAPGNEVIEFKKSPAPSASAVAKPDAKDDASEGKSSPPAMLLQAVEGASSIEVADGDGAKREVKAGEALRSGDVIATGGAVSATVAYEQGAQVIVSNDARVQLGQESEGDQSVPSVAVHTGDTHVLVEKYQAAEPAAGATTPSSGGGQAAGGKAHKFIIRTSAAVMGVRGTDFVVSVGEDSLGLHTLSGTVEVASDLKQLGAGSEKIAVSGGEELTTDGRTHLGTSRPFEVDGFMKEFHKKHPAMEKLYKKAQQDVSDGTLSEKFVSLRAARGKEPQQLQKGNGPDEIEFKSTKKAPAKPKPRKTPTN